jgi:hypothetical protein
MVVTICLHCGAKFRGPVDLNAHWDDGRCRKRQPELSQQHKSFMPDGELVEDRRGYLCIRRTGHA